MLWRRFYRKGVPIYLAKHYWWAYLWSHGVWFFNHQMIINAILFGQYSNLVDITLSYIKNEKNGRILQLTCAYGHLTSSIIKELNKSDLFIADVATIQLDIVRNTVEGNPDSAIYAQHLTRLNAEYLAYRDNSFDTIIIYFLLHELPEQARTRVLTEAIRVLKPGGKLIITEYAEISGRHYFHRNLLIRWILGMLEPFLSNFWQQNLHNNIIGCAQKVGKGVRNYREQLLFNKFYRVVICEL